MPHDINHMAQPGKRRFGSTYGIGDKVMQVENDYDKEVYNGDFRRARAADLPMQVSDQPERVCAKPGRPAVNLV